MSENRIKPVEAELLAMSRLASEGFVIYTPITHHTSADFIAMSNENLKAYTIQVKSTIGECRDRKGRYVFNIRAGGKTSYHRRNKNAVIDFIAFVVSDIREVRFERYEELKAETKVTYHIKQDAKNPWKVNYLKELL
jgi:hypothetical protein